MKKGWPIKKACFQPRICKRSGLTKLYVGQMHGLIQWVHEVILLNCTYFGQLINWPLQVT